MDNCLKCGKENTNSQLYYCDTCFAENHRFCAVCGGMIDHLPNNYTLCRTCFHKAAIIGHSIKISIQKK